MPVVPIREPSIAALRDAPIYFRWGSNKRRTLVDALSAGAVIAVYDVVNEPNKEKLERMVARSPAHLAKVVEVCLSHCKIGGAK